MRQPSGPKGWLAKKGRPGGWISLLIWLCAIDFVIIAGALVARFFQSGLHFSLADLGPLMLAAGVLVALITLLSNKQRDASGDFLKTAVDLLAKSYDVLSQTSHDTGQTRRLNWLTAARLLGSAETIAAAITEESHRRIWNNEREYWRTCFRDRILSSTDFPQDFFAEKPAHLEGRSHRDDPTATDSLATLYRFIHWQENE